MKIRFQTGLVSLSIVVGGLVTSLGGSNVLAGPAIGERGRSGTRDRSKAEVVQALRGWRERVMDLNRNAVDAQKAQLKTLASLKLKREQAVQDLMGPMDELETLDTNRLEFESRLKIIDQLIFAVDTNYAKLGSRWNSATLASFLETQLMELATTDLAEPGNGSWWKFLIQASIAMREVIEPGEDPIRFLELYTRDSSVMNPKSVIEIRESRRYVGE